MYPLVEQLEDFGGVFHFVAGTARRDGLGTGRLVVSDTGDNGDLEVRVAGLLHGVEESP